MLKKGIGVLIILILFWEKTSAQCAMCKAIVESGLEAGGGIGSGLNSGILYLMAFPYILLLLFSIVWVLNRKESQKT